MPRVRSTRVTVTGHVVFDQNFGGCGDIYLYWRDVTVPTVEGDAPKRPRQPGYVCARIYDGSGWCELHLGRLVPYEYRSCLRVTHRGKVTDRVKCMVQGWRGECADYSEDSSGFRLSAQELP